MFALMLFLGVWTNSCCVAALKTSKMAFVAGSNAVLTCDANSPASVRWTYASRTSTSLTTIYSGGKVIDSMTNRITSGYSKLNRQHYITVNALTESDAGLYTCLDETSGEDNIVFSLYILSRSPGCYSTANDQTLVEDSELIEVGCYIEHVVDLSPLFVCSNDARVPFVNKSEVTNGSGSFYRSLVPANQSLHGSRIACSIKLSIKGHPAYEYSWQSPALKVAYGPSSLNIAGVPASNEYLHHGDVLTCSALGNPPPTYHWVYDDNLHRGDTLQIDVCRLEHDKKGKGERPNVRPTEITCVSKRGTRTSTSIVTVNIYIPNNVSDMCRSDSGDSLSQFRVFVVGGVVGVVLLIVVVGLSAIVGCYRHRASAAKRRTATQQLALPEITYIRGFGSLGGSRVNSGQFASLQNHEPSLQGQTERLTGERDNLRGRVEGSYDDLQSAVRASVIDEVSGPDDYQDLSPESINLFDYRHVYLAFDQQTDSKNSSNNYLHVVE